ncbi:hypothetical protein H2198_002735 [Neophaeococcomyces mojaviensis]|uniref:Uncharacterized protein n=1 Tax=Neophaeococcomyces mojaviensis TaxID=3383035 RepID=A0ACC3ADK5_9EURO|nr:hypothetical protein H2198_002735 [Knufia sp. JES_112]
MDVDEDRTDLSGGILASDFDPVQYLNDSLPNLNLTSQGPSAKQSRTAQLLSSSTDIQGQLGRLNAYNARASAELTALTDEILRSSNRLAYEVEVLRSDANGLFDLLSDTLKDDIRHFVADDMLVGPNGSTDEVHSEVVQHGGLRGPTDPEFMQQLRMLGHVKSRLEEVVHVFGEALKWPVPASDVSVASSLISVSAPELGVVSSAEDDKARTTIRQYREEIVDLLSSEGGGYAGVDAAQKRVSQFRNLALVWKSTVEEKARSRIVDSFAKVVDDRKRALSAQNQGSRPYLDSTRSSAQPSRTGTPGLPTGGLFGGLRKLRDEIYLD